MNFKPFRHSTSRANAASTKPGSVAPPPRSVSAAPPQRVWSLLLPPGFTRDGRR